MNILNMVRAPTLSTNVGPSLLVAVHKAGVDVVRPLKTTQAEIVSCDLMTSARDGRVADIEEEICKVIIVKQQIDEGSANS